MNTFILEARSWGYGNSNITKESLTLLGETLGQVPNLNHLELDLHCWTYQNNFDMSGAQIFF